MIYKLVYIFNIFFAHNIGVTFFVLVAPLTVYVTKGQTYGYRDLQLEKQSGDIELRGIPQEYFFYIGGNNSPRSGKNKFQKIPSYSENSPRSRGKRLWLFMFFSIFFCCESIVTEKSYIFMFYSYKKIFQVILLLNQ